MIVTRAQIRTLEWVRGILHTHHTPYEAKYWHAQKVEVQQIALNHGKDNT